MIIINNKIIHTSSDLIKILQEYEEKCGKNLILYIFDEYNKSNKGRSLKIVEIIDDLRFHYNKKNKKISALMFVTEDFKED